MSDPKFLRKNRYSDILTYKHSRIDLLPRESCHDSMFDLKALDPEYDSYINANFIDVSYVILSNLIEEPPRVW
jgi:protein tyrosine phosphatase